MNLSRILQGPLGYKSPSLSPISCLLERLLSPRPSLGSKEQAQAITNEESKWRNAETKEKQLNKKSNDNSSAIKQFQFLLKEYT